MVIQMEKICSEHYWFESLACLVLRVVLKTDRLMRTNFKQEIYGQRWQVETVFSMIKRNFGSAVRARNIESQAREMMLLVLTHNIAIIQLVKELFYRAGQTPLR